MSVYEFVFYSMIGMELLRGPQQKEEMITT